MSGQVRSVTLPGTPDQVRVARRFVADTLGDGHGSRSDAVLLVSETATNAVEHTGSGDPGGRFTVTVRHTETWARVTIADEGSHNSPCFCRVSAEATAGRGTEILDGYAVCWGITRSSEGTRVWFDVGHPAPSPGQPGDADRGLEVERAGDTGGSRPELPQGHGTAAQEDPLPGHGRLLVDNQRMLDEIVVEEAVRALRPDFAVLVLVAHGLENGPGDAESAGWLTAAARTAAPEDPHVGAWKEAYKAFGAKPNRTRPSVDALLRRADALPSINRVVDAYNAVSVEYALPIGGEDLDTYRGPARLTIATGKESFGDDEAPVVGEVIWRDDEGVTCRRWNWRQAVRTRITEDTKNALFLLERLDPYPLERLDAAGEALATRLRAISPDVEIHGRLYT
ncbi:MAG: phenylalanine--tRNA ligase beta subunit-related protein [Streptosporangiaceae bacterium]